MNLNSDKVPVLAMGGAALLFIVVAGGFAWTRSGHREPPDARSRTWIEVERVRSGDKVISDPDDKVLWAGIRAPFKDEPFFEESKRRNEELVGGREVRLRFEEVKRDKKGRLLAYAFVDGEFVNQTLVREGLAYARITTTTQRFAQELLAAQAQARRKKRGLWHERSDSRETSYPADPRYGNFHRPSCELAATIKSERLVVFKRTSDAFKRGFAPCGKCAP